MRLFSFFFSSKHQLAAFRSKMPLLVDSSILSVKESF